MDLARGVSGSGGAGESTQQVALDGNEAAASVAYRASEVIAIYPITPSSAMGELSDEWAAHGRPNLWGAVPDVVEMQSEGGAAGAVHGALQAGALATTFTASQGLLLMIPNMFKIAGELTSFCMHVSARTVATHALSIFGDHSDVMACRQTGFAMLASGSVQEAHDLAAIAHAATLRARVPFLHFFDGFRTSHEIQKIQALSDEDLRAMLDEGAIAAHRARALTPDRPVIRGTAQNPDAFFQAREAANPFYAACPRIVEEMMERFAALTGRRYGLFEYVGHPEADRVIVLMGSGAETVHETVEALVPHHERVGVVKVRLYRPFSVAGFAAALPPTVRSIAVLDRTKEPGATGEPLYLDVVSALRDGGYEGVHVIGGRYGLSSKEFTPGMVKAVFDELKKGELPRKRPRVEGASGSRTSEAEAGTPKRHFTVGIIDDVTHSSLPVQREFDVERDDVVRAVFFGLGSDGTVGANKNSIKIISEEPGRFAQGYFVYDSKKSGAVTISHLRFGPRPIRAPYLIGRGRASFVACHRFELLERYDVLGFAAPRAVLLLNAPFAPSEARPSVGSGPTPARPSVGSGPTPARPSVVSGPTPARPSVGSGPKQLWDRLPREVQEKIIDDEIALYAIDAEKVAEATGMGGRVNTIMQTCFFALSGVLPREDAIARIKAAIEKTYRKKGEEVVKKNFAAVDETLAHLHRIAVPARVTSERSRRAAMPGEAPAFVKEVTAPLLAGDGDWLPVSAFPPDGTWPVGTAKWEKRNLAREIPVWVPDLCIQCNKCALVCPHAAIRATLASESDLESAPPTLKSMEVARKRERVESSPDEAERSREVRSREAERMRYLLQVAPEDCTGCALCEAACPAHDRAQPGVKALAMRDQAPLREAERANWGFFERLPPVDRRTVKPDVKGSQLLEPLFEFSGACSGCGETPYVKLLTQLFGDRALIANATGCSSIFGGNLPTTPYTANREGRGPAWSNSLFEDNAEFGLGFRLAVDKQKEQARDLLRRLARVEGHSAGSGPVIGDGLAAEILESDQASEAGIAAMRVRVAALKRKLAALAMPEARRLETLADYLVEKSVWIVGGDGWAYDIGYGGLDHVIALGRKVNILVLDTEVYSNTGGQQSKATPLGATARFASAGKERPKKDLALMAMAYGTIYVARVALGAKDAQTVQAFREAESYPGPSLIIAFSPCIAHGYDLHDSLAHQKLAVETGVWPLLRFDPRRAERGESGLVLDSAPPPPPPPTEGRPSVGSGPTRPSVGSGSTRPSVGSGPTRPSVGSGPRLDDLERYMLAENRFREVERDDPERFRRLLESERREVASRFALYERIAGPRAPVAPAAAKGGGPR